MRNLHEWEDMIGSNGRYQIRLLEDGKTIEVKGCTGKREGILLKRKNKDGYDIYTICYVSGTKTTMRAHQLSYRQWVEPDYSPNGSKMVVDHKDSDETNNHPDNLRLITHRENCSKEKTIKSRLPVGVYWAKEKRKYAAQITINRKRMALGRYKSIEEASNAYQKALKELAHV